MTVGSDGAFTGRGYLYGIALFSRKHPSQLYGSKPSDFQLSSLRCRGVAKGAARSLCVINETLYYLSPDGVMAWDGSIPTKVSTALDPARLRNVKSALGGALDGRYYLHLVRGSGEAQAVRLLVYDTERGLWQEEDVCSYEMAGSGGQLYLWDGKAIWAADADREENWQQAGGIEDGVSFELVSGDIGLDSPGRAVSLPADAPARGRGEEPHRGGGELRQRSVGDTGPADRRRAALLRCSVCAEAVREPAAPAEGQRSAHPAQPDPDERRREGRHSGTGGELNMASVTGLSKIGLPHLSENMDAEDARAIRNYLYQMQEQLQYVLCNLDVENMSEPLRARLNSIQ